MVHEIKTSLCYSAIKLYSSSPIANKMIEIKHPIKKTKSCFFIGLPFSETKQIQGTPLVKLLLFE